MKNSCIKKDYLAEKAGRRYFAQRNLASKETLRNICKRGTGRRWVRDTRRAVDRTEIKKVMYTYPLQDPHITSRNIEDNLPFLKLQELI